MKTFAHYIRIGMGVGTGIALALLVFCSLTYLAAQQIKTFTAGEVVSATDINANFASLRSEALLKPPVGSIIAWHKTLGGVPALPAGWLECDGSTVADPDSPLNGRVLPDLNGGARFLRGGATSGALQADAFQGHNHELAAALNNLNPPDFTATAGVGVDLVRTNATRGPVSDGVNGTPRIANETRPVNMSVVWIMRVK